MRKSFHSSWSVWATTWQNLQYGLTSQHIPRQFIHISYHIKERSYLLTITSLLFECSQTDFNSMFTSRLITVSEGHLFTCFYFIMSWLIVSWFYTKVWKNTSHVPLGQLKYLTPAHYVNYQVRPYMIRSTIERGLSKCQWPQPQNYYNLKKQLLSPFQ